MFNFIKNLFNINNNFVFNFFFKNSQKIKKLNLTCFLKNSAILSYDDYIYVNRHNKLGVKLLEFLDEFEESYKNEKIFLLEVEIKNCSLEQIKKSDFYENDSLMIKIPYKLISISIDNNKTKKYINASINDKNNECFYINFDTIEPNDSIYIKILHELDFINVDSIFDIMGKTISFDKPSKVYLDGQLAKGSCKK